jgi:hypothetical protein
LLVAVLFAGCNDTAVVLKISSNRPTNPASTAIDAICVELDGGGSARFGRRYGLASLMLPQTLTVLPGGKSSVQVLVYGLWHGVEVARARGQVDFVSHGIVNVDIAIDKCQPRAPTAQFNAAGAPVSGAVDAAILAPGPSSIKDGDLVLAMAAGRSQRYSATAGGLMPLNGGAPTAAAGRVRQIVAADVDGDCRLDAIIVADGAPVSAWRDAADGTFTQLSSFGPADALSAAAGDVNGDGNVDVVAVGGGAAHVYLGDGAGQFHEQAGSFDAAPGDATAVALVDLNGDGTLDAVVGQGSTKADVSRVYLNDPKASGHFAFASGALPPQLGRAAAIAVGDADADGDNDVVISELGGPVRLYLNRGDAYLDDRSFDLLPDQTSGDVPALAYTDLNGDCLPDLVVPRAGGAPLLWLSSGGGMLVAGPAFDKAQPAAGALADDIDGNGLTDVVLYGGAQGLQVELQK